MESSFSFIDPLSDFDTSNPLHPEARQYPGKTGNGKDCVLIDNTGKALPADECLAILDSLVASQLFGFRSMSAQGGSTIDLERRESTHIQIGDDLYRLIIFRYEARIENF